MAELVLAQMVAKWPHISPNGILFGCIVLMALSLAIAIKWPSKTQKK
jgi:hypothetical protein